MNYGILSEDSTVGERVRYFRKKRNMTQAFLARCAGCSVGVISRLECHNCIPSADILLAIARELDVPPIYIFRNSSYITVIFMCVPGKTTFSEDGNMLNFEMVQISSDFKVDKTKFFCVAHDNKRFLAKRGLTEECELYLCIDSVSGKCLVIKNSDKPTLSGTYKIIAGLTDDITDISTTVSM